MTRQITSIGLYKTKLPLDNEQNCEEKSVDASTSTPRSFRTNRMQYNNPHPKRDFGSIGSNTELHGYCAIRGVAR